MRSRAVASMAADASVEAATLFAFCHGLLACGNRLEMLRESVTTAAGGRSVCLNP